MTTEIAVIEPNPILAAIRYGHVLAARKVCEVGRTILTAHPHTGEIRRLTIESIVEGDDGEKAALGRDSEGELFAFFLNDRA